MASLNNDLITFIDVDLQQNSNIQINKYSIILIGLDACIKYNTSASPNLRIVNTQIVSIIQEIISYICIKKNLNNFVIDYELNIFINTAYCFLMNQNNNININKSRNYFIHW